jgi:hypothetical protein
VARSQRSVRDVILGDAWVAVGGIGSVVAAAAALVTILFARQTVRESVVARQENREAHDAEMREQSAALEVAATAHREEMAERRRALEADIKLQRIIQMERVAETLLDLIRVARDEEMNPLPQIPSLVRGMTLIPSVLSRLQASIVLLGLLGPGTTPLRAADLAYRGAGMQPLEIIGAARDALVEIVDLGRNDTDLRFDAAD